MWEKIIVCDNWKEIAGPTGGRHMLTPSISHEWCNQLTFFVVNDWKYEIKKEIYKEKNEFHLNSHFLIEGLPRNAFHIGPRLVLNVRGKQKTPWETSYKAVSTINRKH